MRNGLFTQVAARRAAVARAWSPAWAMKRTGNSGWWARSDCRYLDPLGPTDPVVQHHGGREAVGQLDEGPIQERGLLALKPGAREELPQDLTGGGIGIDDQEPGRHA